MKRVLWFVPLVVLASGCAESPRLVLPSQLESIQQRVVGLEKQSAQDQLEVERLKKRVADLEAAAQESTSRVPAPAAASSPVRQPPVTTTPAPPPTATSPAAGPIEESELAEEPPSPSSPSDATAAYERALRLLRDGQPAAAEDSLRDFTERFPSSDLADNAWFWIGESRRVRNDLPGALAAYRTTIDRYPSGNKVPDALFKLGDVLELQGHHASAREAWAELVRRFPSTAAAENARSRLARP